MGGKMSRTKGAKGELEVAEMLRAWWEPACPGAIFKRTPSSGGWGNKQARAEFRTSGDLVTTSHRFPFCVEIKRREGWTIANVACGRPSPVWAWWQQAQKAAAEGCLEPLLIMRKSKQPWFAIVTAGYAWKMKLRTEFIGSAVDRAWGDYGPSMPALLPLEHILKDDPRRFITAL